MFETLAEWVFAPIDPSREHDIAGLSSWHARFMIAAWVILIPLGVLLARFFKIWPGQDWPRELDNPRWWHLHLLLQILGATASAIGMTLILIFLDGAIAIGTPHRAFGWATILFLCVQILGGILRGTKGGPTYPAPDGSWRGDHYDMTTRRRVFEYIHKYCGYLTLGLAAMAVLSGLWDANAPVWMWLAVTTWWIGFLLIFALFQSRGLAVDTYQAIWGTDDRLPGNRIEPIGFGITRPGDGKTSKTAKVGRASKANNNAGKTDRASARSAGNE